MEIFLDGLFVFFFDISFVFFGFFLFLYQKQLRKCENALCCVCFMQKKKHTHTHTHNHVFDSWWWWRGETDCGMDWDTYECHSCWEGTLKPTGWSLTEKLEPGGIGIYNVNSTITSTSLCGFLKLTSQTEMITDDFDV